MKGKRRFLTGIVLGALIGGVLAFLCMAFIIQNASVLLGFIACLVCLACALLVVQIIKRSSRLTEIAGNQSATHDGSRTFTNVWIGLTALVILASVVGGFLIIRQNALIVAQVQYEKKHSAQQSELIMAIGMSNMVVLMENLLDKVDDELKHDPKRILSDETIARIAALSYSFHPYRYMIGDSASVKAFSPERGQLLLALSKMQIDTSSLYGIMLQTSFAGADLRDADLGGAYLRGVDLSGADLQNAKLDRINLHEAKLKWANLWGADLRNADLRKTDLTRADLRWADLHEANLQNADLSSAYLSSAQLRKADLRKTILQWADYSGAFFNEANLSGADFLATNLEKAHFTGSNLCETNFTRTNLTEAEFTGAIVTDEKWLMQLPELQVVGATEMQERYKIVHDTSEVACQFRIELQK